MKSFSQKYVIDNIHERTIRLRGREVRQFVASYGTNTKGKTIRITSFDKEELVEKIRSHFEHIKEMGGLRHMLSVQQAYDALEAYEIMRKAGIEDSLSMMAEKYVKVFAGGGMAGDATTTIGDVFDAFVADTKDELRRPLEYRTTQKRTGAFVTFFGRNRKIDEVNEDGVLQFLRKIDNDTTYNKNLDYIKTFLNWCVKPSHKYLTVNPILGIERKVIPWKEPQYTPVEDVERIMRLLESKKMYAELGYMVLWFFAGVRDAEIARIMSDDDAATINLDENVCRVVKVKGSTKGVRPRAFAFEDNALAWIRRYDLIDALRAYESKPQYLRECLHDLFVENGIILSRNAGRHSFITYHVAKYGEPQKTQAMCGTSDAMLCNHYRGLASRKAGEAYFAIMPAAA